MRPIRPRLARTTARRTRKVIARQALLQGQVEKLRLKKMQQERDRYAELFDYAPFGYFLCDKKGRILDLNEAGVRMLAWRKKEMLATPFSNYVAGEDLAAFNQLWGRLSGTGKQGTRELQLLRQNGTTFWAKLECLFAAQEAGAGHNDNVYITVTDLSPIKRIQSAFEFSEERYFTLLDLLPHGINEVDLQGRIIYTNPAFAVMHGYEASELVGVHVWDLLACEQDKKIQREFFAWVVENQPPPGSSIRLKNKRKDGSTVDIQVGWSYRRDADQKLLGFVSVIADITTQLKAEEAMGVVQSKLESEIRKRTEILNDTVKELRNELEQRKNAQLALQESEEHFQAFAHACNDFICLFDPAGRFIFAGQAVEYLLGYKPENVLGRHFEEFVHPDDFRAAADDFQAILAGRKVEERQFRARRRDNTWIPVGASGFLCDRRGDRYVGVIVRDCSKQRVQAEEGFYPAVPRIAPLEKSLNGIMMVGWDRQILFFNQRWIDLWTLPPEAMQRGGADGPVFMEIANTLRNPQDFLDAVTDLLAHPEAKSREELVLLDGRVLECCSSPINGNGQPEGRVWNVRDISEIKQAQQSLKIMEYAISSSVNAICFVDLDGRITYVNRAFLDMWSLDSREQVLGQDVRDSNSNPSIARKIWDIVMKKGAWRGQLRARLWKSSEIHVLMSANLLRDDSGTPIGMMGALVDISAKVKTSLALQESERRYRTIFESSTDGFCVVEKSRENCCTKVIDCNEAFVKMAGFSKNELLSMSCVREMQTIFKLPGDSRGCGGKVSKNRPCRGNFSWRRPDGKENFIECRGTPIEIDGRDFNLCVHRDNTEKRKAEEQIKNLSAQLVLVAEEERKRIARDLHDEFGQLLPALGYHLENLRQHRPKADWPPTAEFTKIATLMEKLGTMARTISYDLRPSLLDDFGLVTTLAQSTEEFMARHQGVKAAFRVAGAQRKLSADMEIILYRVFQEAMNNIAKHSRAQNVNVSLTFSYPSIILMVVDDGVGFDLHHSQTWERRRKGGIGLLGIRERIASMEGKLAIRSEPGKGTYIRAEIVQERKTVEDRYRCQAGCHFRNQAE